MHFVFFVANVLIIEALQVYDLVRAAIKMQNTGKKLGSVDLSALKGVHK